MALDSNAIWSAITSRITDAVGGEFRRVSRRRRDFGLEEQPALLVLDDSGDEVPITDPYDPAPVWKITGEIVILARANDTDEAPTEKLNALKFAVLDALERKPSDPIGNGLSHYTDLGGLVRVLSVTKVEKGSAGDKTGQAVVKIGLAMEAL